MLTPREGDRRVPTNLYQRFAFNLSWSPEDFKEVPQTTEELVDPAELELF
jgi:hypothetical protein